MYKVMMMASIEQQEIGAIMKNFYVILDTQDPNFDYYVNKLYTPTTLFQNLVKDLSKNEKIFDTESKMIYIGKIVDLIQLIRNSFREHLASLHARTFVEIKLF